MAFDLSKLQGLLGMGQGGAMLGGAQAAQAAQGSQINPWRVLDGVLGGKTISQSYDMEHARQAAQGFQSEIGNAFQGPAPQAQPGMTMAPRAEEVNGVLGRSLQAEPTLAPPPGAQPAKVNRMPSMEELAPILGRAEAGGYDTSGVRGVLGEVRDDRLAGKPKVYQTDRGLIERDPATGAVKSIYDEPAKIAPAPAGYRWNAQGQLEAIPGGPADPKTIGGNAGVRRSVLVGNPMPSRARAASTGSSQPWKRGWSQ